MECGDPFLSHIHFCDKGITGHQALETTDVHNTSGRVLGLDAGATVPIALLKISHCSQITLL